MKTTRLLVTFYSSFAFASLMITISCLTMTYAWGAITFTILFWFKISTLGMIYYYINSFQKDGLYYYKNLGLTKKTLWISTLTFDLAVFLILVITTLSIR